MLRGLLVDFGGVLTTDVFAAFREFCAAEGLAPEAVTRRLADYGDVGSLVARFECGEVDEPAFEAEFAAMLGIGAAGLLDRLFAGVRPDPVMAEAVRAVRAAGIRTAMVSNSWGDRGYDRPRFPELFDVVVLSGEVGLRKPDPAIYALAAARSGLEPEECVFVDDLPPNVEGARAAGMTAIHHTETPRTLEQLERLLGVDLAR